MKIYMVQKGDTLNDIAEKHGLSLSELKQANTDITETEELTRGMKIKVPSASRLVRKEGSPAKEIPLKKMKSKAIPVSEFLSNKKEHAGKINVKVNNTPIEKENTGNVPLNTPINEPPMPIHDLDAHHKMKHSNKLSPTQPLNDSEWELNNEGHFENNKAIPFMDSPYPNLMGPAKTGPVKQPMKSNTFHPQHFHGYPSQQPVPYYPYQHVSPGYDPYPKANNPTFNPGFDPYLKANKPASINPLGDCGCGSSILPLPYALPDHENAKDNKKPEKSMPSVNPAHGNVPVGINPHGVHPYQSGPYYQPYPGGSMHTTQPVFPTQYAQPPYQTGYPAYPQQPMQTPYMPRPQEGYAPYPYGKAADTSHED